MNSETGGIVVPLDVAKWALWGLERGREHQFAVMAVAYAYNDLEAVRIAREELALVTEAAKRLQALIDAEPV